jgi:hypothetical protein
MLIERETTSEAKKALTSNPGMGYSGTHRKEYLHVRPRCHGPVILEYDGTDLSGKHSEQDSET